MVSGYCDNACRTWKIPSSIRFAITISPSRVSSSTVPISRMYMRTVSLVRPVSLLSDAIMFAASSMSSGASSVVPKSDEEIKSDINQTSTQTTRYNCIEDFSLFVNSENNLLMKFSSHPGFCHQHAFNFTKHGSISKAAEKTVKSDIEGILFLKIEAHRAPYNPRPALRKTIALSDPSANFIKVTNDGKRIVTVSQNFIDLNFWDLESRQLLNTLKGHREFITCISMTPDGKKLISGDLSGYLYFWDLENGYCLNKIKGNNK